MPVVLGQEAMVSVQITVELPLWRHLSWSLFYFLLFQTLSLHLGSFFWTQFNLLDFGRFLGFDALPLDSYAFVLHLRNGEPWIELQSTLLRDVGKSQLDDCLSKSGFSLGTFDSLSCPNDVID
jgi:hypothetical protein